MPAIAACSERRHNNVMEVTINSIKRELSDFVTGAWLRPPSAHQVAALCWRRAGEGHEVLLVTTRRSGQWMVPKGWPEPGRPDPEMAAVEAYEEAGASGTLKAEPVGRFHYDKAIGCGARMECNATLYALEVSELAEDFPESGERELRWFSPDEAAIRVKAPELSALLRTFTP
ncbi:NUDIX hydrolase [Hyphomonas sp.]|uniref:NUDIX hydrolase n=1 Tax=Hyphomonas sp. TaxID=87 RepID=UPI003F6F57C2|tara:strand:+ start:1544 stop:2062 length:519 start_codon:yes stop_codon:yes gene_type:complete